MDWLKFEVSPLDTRDKIVTFSNQVTFPHVDLLPDVEEVENQLNTGSCTANAAVSALEIAYKRAGQSKDFSRLYNYWYSRQLGNIVGDKGAYPRDVCKALNKYGICLESTWEFNIQQNLNIEPSIEAQEEAKKYPIYEYSRLTSTDIISQIKQCVSAGIPVMTSIKVSNQFNTLGKNWKEHDWDPTKDYVGAHQVLIIGYNDQSQRFLAQNSWSSFWGDGGFFGIPYSRIGINYNEPNTSAYEYWILNKLDVAYIPANGIETEPKDPTENNNNTSKTLKNIWVVLIIIFIIAYYMV